MPKQSERHIDQAALCAADLKDRLAFCKAGGWHWFSGNVWSRIDKEEAYLRIGEWLCPRGHENTACATKWVAELVSVHLRREFALTYGVIPFSNVLLDVTDPERWKILPHSPELSTNWVLDYDWHDGTGGTHAPVTDALLANLLQCHEEKIALEALVGLALMRDCRIQKCILIAGAPGTGKSTLLEHILTTCGHSKNDGGSKELFRADDGGANVRQAHINDRITVVDEFPADAVAQDEGLFKRMVTADTVRLKTLYRDTVDAQWVPKLLFVANDLPKFGDCSGAIARRLLPIRAEGVIEEPDPNYADKLHAERAVWARRCLIHALMVLADGEMPACDHTREFLTEIAAEGDPFKGWVTEECDLGREYYAKGEELWSAWRVWATRNGEKASTKRALLKSLGDYRPWRLKRGKAGEQGAQIEVIRGIRLKEDVAVSLQTSTEGWKS